MKNQQLPDGWTEDAIRELAKRHDNMTEKELAAEMGLSDLAEDETVMIVPTSLVPEINALISKRLPA